MLPGTKPCWNPAAMVTPPGLMLAAGIAVPESAIVCGLPGALSVMVSVAESDPGAVGANATVIVHLSDAASAVPQEPVALKSPGFNRAKSPEFVPVIAMLEIV